MLEVINDFLSGKILIPLVLGLGGYFTIRSRFVQFRYFLHMLSVLRGSWRTGNHHLSSLQALTLSLAGRVGTGRATSLVSASP
jgi:AGCS family alanine or glycine:cation symporter